MPRNVLEIEGHGWVGIDRYEDHLVFRTPSRLLEFSIPVTASSHPPCCISKQRDRQKQC